MIRYENCTIEEAYDFEYYDLICDGDSKRFVIVPNEKYFEIGEEKFNRYIKELKERTNAKTKNA